jgi:hypothetical protein
MGTAMSEALTGAAPPSSAWVEAFSAAAHGWRWPVPRRHCQERVQATGSPAIVPSPVSLAPPTLTPTDAPATHAAARSERWFGVPATITIVAPTRTAADELAETIAKERLSRMLDFSVRTVRVIGRQPPAGGARRASTAWIVEAVFAIKAAHPDEARREVERVCRREAAETHLVLDFGAARKIEDEERLNAMSRRLLAWTVSVLTSQLREDLVEIADGTAFEDTRTLAAHLPARSSAAYDLPLLERWVDAVEVVGVDLLRYPETYFASTAEELAGHAILHEARDMLDLVGETPAGEAAREQLEQKIDEIHDAAFEDHDILMAFGKSPSPIEENPAVADMMGIVNFTPDDWFRPFRQLRDV